MNLLIQPGDGSKALLDGINAATKSIELVIFRFDRREIEAALSAAAARGVFIHTLVTFTNRGGEKHLRQLEQRLLEAGVTVARTAGNLSRYHNKLMIIDRRMLFLLAFNFTSMDIDHSRSFGIVTEEASFVREAVKLFEADTTRQPYTADLDTFVVSPVNAADLVEQFFNSSEKRLARILLLLAHFGKESRAETVVPRVNQKNLAKMVGITRSQVSHFMNKFRRLGFIDYSGNGGLKVQGGLLTLVLHD